MGYEGLSFELYSLDCEPSFLFTLAGKFQGVAQGPPWATMWPSEGPITVVSSPNNPKTEANACLSSGDFVVGFYD